MSENRSQLHKDTKKAHGTKAKRKDSLLSYMTHMPSDMPSVGIQIPEGYHQMPDGSIMADSEHYQEGGQTNAEKAIAIRPFPRYNNPADSSDVSTVVMNAETFDGKNWYGFPSIFPKEGNASSGDPKDWLDFGDDKRGAYEEALKRGEVFEFGEDKQAALDFGEGSWKPEEYKKYGGNNVDPYQPISKQDYLDRLAAYNDSAETNRQDILALHHDQERVKNNIENYNSFSLDGAVNLFNAGNIGSPNYETFEGQGYHEYGDPDFREFIIDGDPKVKEGRGSDGVSGVLNDGFKYWGQSFVTRPPKQEILPFDEMQMKKTVTPKKQGKTSYEEAYKNADKKKYPTLASFEKAAKEYNNPTPKAIEKEKTTKAPYKITTAPDEKLSSGISFSEDEDPDPRRMAEGIMSEEPDPRRMAIPTMSEEPRSKPLASKEQGGQIMELDDNAIEQYRKMGYVIEEIDSYAEGGDIITQGKWQYKKEGDNYLTREEGRHGEDEWITAKGHALNAIKNDIYHEGTPPQEQPAVPGQPAPQPVQQDSYITSIQKDLEAKGYDLGPTGADGILGTKTKKAMKADESGISADDYNKGIESTGVEPLTHEDIQTTKQNLKTSGRYNQYTEYESIIDPNTLKDPDYKRVLKNYDDLFMDPNSYKLKNDFARIINNTRTQVIDENGEVTYEGTPSCAKGAFNCESQYVTPLIGVTSTRGSLEEIGNISETEYSIPSKDPKEKGAKFEHNQSYDSWEIANALLGSGKGYESYKRDANVYGGGKIDYKSIPLGSVVLTTNPRSNNPYTGNRKQSRHTTSVVGFAEDGMPIIFDYGKPRRLEDLTDADHSIKQIVTPNQYKGYDYNSIQAQRAKQDKKLGINKYTPKTYTGDNLAVKWTYKGTENAVIDLAREHDIPLDTVKKMQDRVVGIGVKETNLNNMADEDLSIWSDFKVGWGDSTISNEYGKPAAKWLSNLSTESGLPAYKVYIEAEKMRDAGDTRDLQTIYDDLRETKYPEPDGKESRESSVGAFKIKDYPEFLTKKYGHTKEHLSGKSDLFEVMIGAEAALGHLTQNYEKLKVKYKDRFTDDQLLDLATIAYNSSSKPYDEDYLKYYVEESKLNDAYLRKVKAFEKKYVNNEQSSVSPMPTDNGSPAGNAYSGPLARAQPNAAEELGFMSFKGGGEVTAEDYFVNYLMNYEGR